MRARLHVYYRIERPLRQQRLLSFSRAARETAPVFRQWNTRLFSLTVSDYAARFPLDSVTLPREGGTPERVVTLDGDGCGVCWC